MAVDWSVEELQLVIDEIISGEKLLELEINDEVYFILLKYPSRQEYRLAEIQMKKVKRKAIRDKFLTEEQMLEQIKRRGIWTDKDDEIVQELRERLEKWKGKLDNPDLTEKAKSTIIEAVELLEEKIFKAEYKREIMLSNTAERKALEEKYHYLAWMCSYDPETNKRMWDNYLTYYELMNVEFRNRLLGELLRYLNGRTKEEIRYVARSNLWRVSYVVAQKTNSSLFPDSIVDLTPDQMNLGWWSSYYQGIYEMMPEDQPEDRIIDDDEALDKYMENLHKERTKERQDSKARKNFGHKSARHMKEQLVMRNNPEYWDLEYDKVPASSKVASTDRTLKDESPAGSKAAKRRSKPITGSKRFKK